MRMTAPNLQIKSLTAAETLTWEIKEGALAPYQATPDAGELDLNALQIHRLNTRGICCH